MLSLIYRIGFSCQLLYLLSAYAELTHAIMMQDCALFKAFHRPVGPFLRCMHEVH